MGFEVCVSRLRPERRSLLNSFSYLIKYGDEFQVLSFSDLIEFHADDTDVTVRLKILNTI